MGLLDGFEKLINEHGSAVILKERISLANDKYAALEAKLSIIEKENLALKTEITELKTENKRLKIDTEQLTIQIQDHDKTLSGHSSSLDKEKVKILAALSKQEWIYTEQISRLTGIGTQVVQFHLDELQENNMVAASYSMGGDTEWTLDHEGRRYLIQNKLIS